MEASQASGTAPSGLATMRCTSRMGPTKALASQVAGHMAEAWVIER